MFASNSRMFGSSEHGRSVRCPLSCATVMDSDPSIHCAHLACLEKIFVRKRRNCESVTFGSLRVVQNCLPEGTGGGSRAIACVLLGLLKDVGIVRASQVVYNILYVPAMVGSCCGHVWVFVGLVSATASGGHVMSASSRAL